MDAIAQATLYLCYGLPGDQIPGSHLIRAYCVHCGDPIRVALGANVRSQECQDCRRATGQDHQPAARAAEYAPMTPPTEDKR